MTTLYRLYAADGALLYVGIADSWPSRMRQHARQKPWWTEVTTVRLEHHPLRGVAERAERAAIQSERPRHNITHNDARQVAPPTITIEAPRARREILLLRAAIHHPGFAAAGRVDRAKFRDDTEWAAYVAVTTTCTIASALDACGTDWRARALIEELALARPPTVDELTAPVA